MSDTETKTVECTLCGQPAQVELVSPSHPVYAPHNIGKLLQTLCDNSGKRITKA